MWQVLKRTSLLPHHECRSCRSKAAFISNCDVSMLLKNSKERLQTMHMQIKSKYFVCLIWWRVTSSSCLFLLRNLQKDWHSSNFLLHCSSFSSFVSFYTSIKWHTDNYISSSAHPLNHSLSHPSFTPSFIYVQLLNDLNIMNVSLTKTKIRKTS